MGTEQELHFSIQKGHTLTHDTVHNCSQSITPGGPASGPSRFRPVHSSPPDRDQPITSADAQSVDLEYGDASGSKDDERSGSAHDHATPVDYNDVAFGS